MSQTRTNPTAKTSKTSKAANAALQTRTYAALRHQRRIAELSHRLDANALAACVGAMEWAARQRGVL